MYQDKKKAIFARNFIGILSGKIRTKIRSSEKNNERIFVHTKMNSHYYFVRVRRIFQELEGTPRVRGSSLQEPEKYAFSGQIK